VIFRPAGIAQVEGDLVYAGKRVVPLGPRFYLDADGPAARRSCGQLNSQWLRPHISCRICRDGEA
jgi:hypothetical protein